MKPLFDTTNIQNISLNELPFICEECNKIFYLTKKLVKHSLKRKRPGDMRFCSNACVSSSRRKTIETKCTQCNKPFNTTPWRKRKSKSGNSFCCKSCAATYNNTHKTIGIRRSKLEKWLEQQLKIKYPDLNILFNDKKTINSELDIYIPSLNLAFEINGIFHYQPIYGQDQFISIQNNDYKKAQLCLKFNIKLTTIDCSLLKHFNEKLGMKYFIEIKNTIENEMGLIHSGFSPALDPFVSGCL